MSDLAVAVETARRADPATRPARRRRRWVLLAVAVPGLVVVVLAIVGPWIATHPVGQTVGRPFSPPGDGHVLGTDRLGRDVLSQLLHGGRRIIVIPLAATVVTAVVGGFLGVVSGYARGWTDSAISRLVDIAIATPSILVVLVLVNGWGSSGPTLVLAMLATSGPYAMRFARAATLDVATAGFVEQAVAVGERPIGVVTRELLPNIAGPLVAEASLRLVGAIFLVGSVSFLGFGPERPATDWATMINENLQGSGLNTWAVIAPALAIVALTASVMVVADLAARRWAR